METRCMAHMALAAGADGLIWYWSPKNAYHIQHDAPTVWEGICDTVGELNALTPFLVAPRTPADRIPVPEPFMAWSRQAGTERVLVLVNTSPAPAAGGIDLRPFRTEGVKSRETGASHLVPDGQLSVRLEGHGVGVYEWRQERRPSAQRDE